MIDATNIPIITAALTPLCASITIVKNPTKRVITDKIITGYAEPISSLALPAVRAPKKSLIT